MLLAFSSSMTDTFGLVFLSGVVSFLDIAIGRATGAINYIISTDCTCGSPLSCFSPELLIWLCLSLALLKGLIEHFLSSSQKRNSPCFRLQVQLFTHSPQKNQCANLLGKEYVSARHICTFIPCVSVCEGWHLPISVNVPWLNCLSRSCGWEMTRIPDPCLD